MLKNEVAVIGIGLAGETVAYEFQKKNYPTYFINGSTQDNNTLPGARNVMVLEGYDGLAGNRELAYEALKKNLHIIKKVNSIEQKIIVCIASGGGTTGSGSIPYINDIIAENPDKIIVSVLLMPRRDEPIQKRLNAYNTAKDLMEIEDSGATIFVNNEAYTDLANINTILVKMLDAFFTDNSSSAGSNFDDSEKMKMLKEQGAFIIAMKSDRDSKTTTQDMIDALTAKNIFLPVNADGIVGNIGVINQKGNCMNEHEIVKAVGVPENIFVGNNGNLNIVCVSGLGYPVEYISKLGETAVKEQRQRLDKRKSISVLEDLNLEFEESVEKPEKQSKRKRISLNLIRELD